MSDLARKLSEEEEARAQIKSAIANYLRGAWRAEDLAFAEASGWGLEKVKGFWAKADAERPRWMGRLDGLTQDWGGWVAEGLKIVQEGLAAKEAVAEVAEAQGWPQDEGQEAAREEALAYFTAALEAPEAWEPGVTVTIDGLEVTLVRALGPGDLAVLAKLTDGQLNEPEAKVAAEVKAGPQRAEVAQPGRIILPGVCGDIQDYYFRTALKPSWTLSLAPAVMVPMTLVAGKVVGPSGARGCSLHQYLAMIAGTTVGKQHLMDVMAWCLKAVKADPLLGPGRFKSGSALIKQLKPTPVMLCRMDEFGPFLAKLGDPKAMWCEKEIADRMKELWGQGPGSVYNTPVGAGAGDDSIAIENTALIIVGLGVKEEFYSACQDIQIRNGFLNRFLLIEEKGRPKLNPNPSQEDFPAGLFQTLMKLKDLKGGRLPWTRAAQDIWVEENARIEALADEGEQMLWGRGPEKIIRLASVFACARFSKVGVERADMELAREIVRMGERPFREGIDEANSRKELSHKELKLEIEKRVKRDFPADGATEYEIERTFKNNKKHKKAVHDAIEDMLLGGTLEPFDVKTAGRPKTLLRLAKAKSEGQA